MIPISDILAAPHVNLALASHQQEEGISEVLSKLNGDPRVVDWNNLTAAITSRNAPAISCGPCGLVIAHGRTDAVSSLLMAAGRSTPGLASPDIKEKVRLVFVAGIPAAFHSEYLRVVGAIARLCKDSSLLEKLLTVEDPQEFIALLSSGEVKL